MSAFAALSLLCIASSCKDQNFDWENAHANTAQQKFTDVFIKEFGQPAQGHQWGFDMANVALGGYSFTGGITRATRANETPSIITANGTGAIKQDMNWAGTDMRIEKFFGRPNDISEREHIEVYNWFSNHKVYWANTPCTYTNSASQQCKKGENGELVPEDADGNYDIWAYTQDESKLNAARNYQLSTIKEKGYYGSLMDYPENGTAIQNAIYVDDNIIKFFNGWIQHVANDTKTQDELTISGVQKGYTSSNMDYFGFVKKGNTSSFVHTLDWNGSLGYGYPGGASDIPANSEGNTTNADGKLQNAELFLGADFNDLCYHSSAGGGGSVHNKYFVVYLKGQGYEGWYLGMDFEACGGDADNMQVPANGICNDWIIKIVSAGNEIFKKSRIMCEDLGGAGAMVGTEFRATDIDYNDIVFDIESNQKDVIDLTLRAAGGTLPLTVWYDDVPLFESHEFLKDGKLITESGHKGTTDEYYATMYNTDPDKELENTATTNPSSRSVKLCFKDAQGDVVGINLRNKNFDIQKIKIKVWRQGNINYRTDSDNDYSDALWVDLENIDGHAPIKICVPQNVGWLKERHEISDGYPSFRDWVADPTDSFWTKTNIVTNHLVPGTYNFTSSN